MANEDIKRAAKAAGVHLWKVAEAYGINDGNFSRKLRRDLCPSDREKILSIIAKLATEKQGVC